jgi:hypothetical protein
MARAQDTSGANHARAKTRPGRAEHRAGQGKVNALEALDVSQIKAIAGHAGSRYQDLGPRGQSEERRCR